jgi:thioester reductase-like protein
MHRKKILLTGATGFIGGELLRRLARQDARTVVCLVRGASPDEARSRGRDTLRALFGRDAERVARKVEWVHADIEKPGLGLSAAQREALARDIEEVFHCAASTSFDLPLEEARRVNVDGVKALDDLDERAVAHGGFRRLHHVSTAYASGKVPGLVSADHVPADEPANFRNSYERTKAEAERFLRERLDRLPITIYRPSIVVGDSRTGRTTSWNVCYYPMRLMAWGRLPYASCGGRALLDVVPVDYVVDGMLALARRDDSLGQTYHLAAGEEALTVHDVIRETYAGMARREGQAVNIRTTALGPFAWACLTGFYGLFGGEALKKALAAFEVYVDYTRVDTVFDCRREREVLDAEGVTFPAPRESFPVAVDYALAQNFGKPWPKAAKKPAPLAARLGEAINSASGVIEALTPVPAPIPASRA